VKHRDDRERSKKKVKEEEYGNHRETKVRG
jgi:hypothetical protein